MSPSRRCRLRGKPLEPAVQRNRRHVRRPRNTLERRAISRSESGEGRQDRHPPRRIPQRDRSIRSAVLRDVPARGALARSAAAPPAARHVGGVGRRREYPPTALAGTDVGVFIGGFTLDYQLLQNQGRTSRYRFKSHSATGMMMTMLANRISHAFDFRGPSMTIDTACSGSLVAVHLAAQSIWNGECDLALAGGVNIMIGPNTAIAESKSGFLSPEGRSKAFDDSADGYARGEGGAVVVIKPLQQALDDGDEIYAQILGTAVSQDGHTDGITVPREEAQEAAIRTALRRAGVQPTEVGYVEAHGTGTPVGDPIEMRALASALTSDRPATNPLLIGSVKTNIGHLEAGAGVAGLIKAALVAKHGYIPANLHLQTPNRHVSLDGPQDRRPRNGPAVSRLRATHSRGELVRIRRHQRPRRARRAARPASASAADDPPQPAADRPADLGTQRGSTGRDGRSVGRAPGRAPRRHAVGSGLHARPTTHASEPSPYRDRRQHCRCARTTSGPRRRRADLHRPHRSHRAEARVRVYRHGPAVVEDVPGAAGRLPRVHRQHPAQRPRAVPLHGLVPARRTPTR